MRNVRRVITQFKTVQQIIKQGTLSLDASIITHNYYHMKQFHTSLQVSFYKTLPTW